MDKTPYRISAQIPWGRVQEVIKIAGVARGTYYRWRKGQKVTAANEAAIINAIEKIINNDDK